MPRTSAESRVQALARDAVRRILRTLRTETPSLADAVESWMKQLGRGGAPHAYFVSQWGYPVLELPWHLSGTIVRSRNAAFDRDLVYSTICGYYCVRLIDDFMDGAAEPGLSLLAAGPVFQSEFQSALLPHLGSDAGFWRLFRKYWAQGFDAAHRDAALSDIDFEDFQIICARKTNAAKIPVAAAFAYYAKLRDAELWLSLCDDWGCFVQMADDIVDFAVDQTRGGARTYFLCEARRRRRKRETPADWARREGFEWALGLCLTWAEKLELQAKKLGAGAVAALVRQRRRALVDRVVKMESLLVTISPLAHYFGG